MFGLLLTLMVLFTPTADIEPTVEPIVTHHVTVERSDAAFPPGTVVSVMYDERVDAATGEIILVPLSGIPYDGPVDEAGTPLQ